MSLVFLAADFPPSRGGIQTVAYELALAIHQTGEQVGVVTVCQEGGTEFDEQCPYPVARVPAGEKLQVAANLSEGVTELIDQVPERPRAIVATKWFPEGLAAINSIRFNRPLRVMIGHGREFRLTGFNPLKWFAQKYILLQMDRGIAVSEWTARQMVLGGIRRNKVSVVNNGVRPENFETPCDVDALRERLRIGDEPVLLTVGRLVERKGHGDVIRLLPELIKQAGPVTYVVAGSGPMEKPLRELAEAVGVDDHVRFAGAVDDGELADYYHLCDAFVMPTRTIPGDPLEGFGVVYLEANSAGKPVIATDCGGVADAVEDGVSGLLLPEGDDAALVDAMARLVTDKDLARSLGEGGRARVKAEFTWDKVAQKFLAALEDGG